MSFVTYFEKARQRSEPERRRLALVLTLAIVGVITLAWVINLRFLWHYNSSESMRASVMREEPRSLLGDTLFRIKNGWQKIIK